ncbi:uncharacterized protein VP01_1796g7 [Puccinia sorghi]|uniref:Uncharacterized protein n=1 Tax=Puccinia sorghi TaxID=27349 RepID=A0A0L6VED0_9BASI|nr:uncharacterized protein VP01_1796g7 [Puccinia sorghi]
MIRLLSTFTCLQKLILFISSLLVFLSSFIFSFLVLVLAIYSGTNNPQNGNQSHLIAYYRQFLIMEELRTINDDQMTRTLTKSQDFQLRTILTSKLNSSIHADVIDQNNEKNAMLEKYGSLSQSTLCRLKHPIEHGSLKNSFTIMGRFHELGINISEDIITYMIPDKLPLVLYNLWNNFECIITINSPWEEEEDQETIPLPCSLITQGSARRTQITLCPDTLNQTAGHYTRSATLSSLLNPVEAIPKPQLAAFIPCCPNLPFSLFLTQCHRVYAPIGLV